RNARWNLQWAADRAARCDQADEQPPARAADGDALRRTHDDCHQGSSRPLPLASLCAHGRGDGGERLGGSLSAPTRPAAHVAGSAVLRAWFYSKEYTHIEATRPGRGSTDRGSGRTAPCLYLKEYAYVLTDGGWDVTDRAVQFLHV